MMTDTGLVALEGVELAYEIDAHLIPVLRGVNLRVSEGEFVLIHGDVGAGKSALVNVMAGLENPTRGQVRVAGIETSNLDQGEARRIFDSFVGFFGPWFRLDARKSIAEVLSECRRAPRYDPEQIAGLLQLDPTDPRPTGTLGAGLRRRVDCARVLMAGPRVIIADLATPPWGSSPDLQDLRRIHHELGITVVATIDHEVEISDARMVALADGRIVERSLSA